MLRAVASPSLDPKGLACEVTVAKAPLVNQNKYRLRSAICNYLVAGNITVFSM